jgi:hypothetical protein
VPTRKWLAARITAVSGLLIMLATTGSWDLEETVALITILTEGSISWLVPNLPAEEVTS